MILESLATDPTIVFTVSSRPFPETPTFYWNGVRRLVFRSQDNAFRYCQRVNDQQRGAYSVLATRLRDEDDLGD